METYSESIVWLTWREWQVNDFHMISVLTVFKFNLWPSAVFTLDNILSIKIKY